MAPVANMRYGRDFGNFLSTHQIFIPHICHRHHRWCLCKKFLSGVNFSRLSEKMHIFDFFRDIFSVFGAFSLFLGVKFGFRKSCLCKKMTNMRYASLSSSFLSQPSSGAVDI